MKHIEKYREDLDRLITHGSNLLAKLVLETKPDYAADFKKKNPERFKSLNDQISQFSSVYQQWYSEAYELIRQLLPSRLGDFEEYYKGKGVRKEITYANYTIKDALSGLQVTRGWDKIKVVGADAAISPMEQQLKIVEAVKSKFDSSLFDIKTLVHAELLDDELSESEVLLKSGFLRAAGALAGVALESHLKTVSNQHAIRITKKSPSISDFNNALKDSVIDTAEWRKIQYLADIRNKCDHKRATEPSEEEIQELISGVKRIIKTLF